VIKEILDEEAVVDFGSDSGDGASDSELFDGYGDGDWVDNMNPYPRG